jgi:putative thioredoxin
MTDVITPVEFENEVVARSATVPVVVDFWAPWCGPCRVLGPALESEIAALGGKVALVKVNVDEAVELAGRFQVSSIPAVKAFRDGSVVSAFEGAVDAATLRRWLAGLLPSEAKQSLERAVELLRRGDADAAAPLLAGIDPRSPEALELDALQRVVALIRRSPDAARGAWEVVSEELFSTVADRGPGRDEALADLRALFDLLGSDTELVRDLRRRLQIVT